MAEKTVTVRLRALVDDYKRAMADAGKATANVADQGDRWKKLGQSTAAVGDSLTRNLTLPLVAVGAAAFKMSADFDQVFTRMQGLAGVSAREVDGLKESVLGLAGETGRAPQELAEALYFLRSSGLDGAQAMDALEQSAKASAAGLGNTATIADAVSSAMNAYSKAGLSAAEATDVLVATARAGKAEPEQLAASLGQVLPIASELGVTFQDVGGAVAALSLSGNDAARSSTLLTNVLSKMLKPSQQGAELLEKVGLSADGIRQMIAEKGLLGTLEELKGRLGDAGFVKFLEDAQAVQGALALTGQNAEKVRDVFGEVADSAGATESAFSTWADSMGSKNARAWADFQAALIRLGDTITPIAADIAGAVSTVADAFQSLPDGVQSAIVYVALFAAALGPLMSVGGRAVSALGGLSTTLANAAASAGPYQGMMLGASSATARLAGSLVTLGKAGIVVGILAAVREAVGSVADEVDRTSLSKLENELLDLAETGDFAGATLERVKDGLFGDIGPGVEGFSRMTTQAREDIDALDDALASLAARDTGAAAEAFERISDALVDQGFSAEQVEERFDSYADAVANADTTNRTTDEAITSATGAIDSQVGALEAATSAAQSYSDTLRAQFDPLFAVTSANSALAQANADVNAAVAEFGAQSPEAIAAHLAAAEAAARQQGALGDLATAVRDGSVSVDAAVAKLNEWVAQGLITQESADATAAEFYGVRDAANSVPGSVSSTVSAPGATAAAADVANLKARIDALPPERTVTITQLFRTVGSAFGFGDPEGRATGGPVSSGKLYEVNEGGKAELLEMGGRTYLLPGMSGHVTPASQYPTPSKPAASSQPGGTTIENLHLTTQDSPRMWLDEIPWRLAS